MVPQTSSSLPTEGLTKLLKKQRKTARNHQTCGMSPKSYGHFWQRIRVQGQSGSVTSRSGGEDAAAQEVDKGAKGALSKKIKRLSTIRRNSNAGRKAFGYGKKLVEMLN